MRFITDSIELRACVQEQRNSGKRIALVPTMGNLHAGHMQLVEEARQHSDFVISTIFVNPLQFGPGEDLDAYPRTLAADRELLLTHRCDALFAPRVEEIYHSGMEQQTTIHVPTLTDKYCGASRPGHFDGVATVVFKLFNLTNPDTAFFGLKDYQQFLVISKMVADLGLGIELVGVETVREASGLAMSSRNGYLNEQQLTQAASIYRCLNTTAAAITSGNHDYSRLEQEAMAELEQAGLRPDYYAICHAKTLQAPSAGDEQLVILAAAAIGNSRLIDNKRVSLTPG